MDFSIIVYYHGIKVFKTADKYKEWLNTENESLSDKPINLLFERKGQELVDLELTKIEESKNGESLCK